MKKHRRGLGGGDGLQVVEGGGGNGVGEQAPEEQEAAPTPKPEAPSPKQYSVGATIQVSGDDKETLRSQAGVVSSISEQLGARRAEYLSFEGQAFQAVTKAQGEYVAMLKAVARKRGINIDSSSERWNYDAQAGTFQRLPDQT